MATTKISSTTTPIVPQWSSDAIADLVRRAQEQSNVDPYSRVAPINSLTDLAATDAAGIGGGTSAAFDEARQVLRDTLGAGPAGYKAESLLENLDAYRNPWTENVVDASLASFDDQAGQQRAGLSLGLAGRRGGSGADIATALTEGQLGLSRGQLESGLRSDAENAAFTYSGQDADRRQSAGAGNAAISNAWSGQKMGAARSLADLAMSEDANARATGGYQADLGTLFRDQEQQIMDAPWTNLERLASIQGTSGMDSLFGSQTNEKQKKSGGLLGSILKAGASAAATAAMSDVRLKRDIDRIGTLPDGLGLYAYRYLWSPVRHIGVMAQEVLKVKPWAVLRHPSGFLMVDYARI